MDGRCVNIHHLYLGTNKQNSIDMVRDGNEWNQKLTEPIVDLRDFSDTVSRFYGP